MESIIKEKNGVTLEANWVPIARGECKGQLYPTFIPTKENLSSWINFHGVDKVITLLERSAKANAQAALNYIAGDGKDTKWSVREVPDVEDPNKVVKQEFIADGAVDWNAVIDMYLSGAAQGGATKAELVDEKNDLQNQLQRLVAEASDASLSTEARQAKFNAGFELVAKIQDLDAAIQAKSKSRQPKEEKAA